MAKQFKLSMLFRYLFLYSLLGYSAFLAVEGRLDASGAVLGGSVALFSLQKPEDNAEPESEEWVDNLRLQLLETQHEVEYYKYKLVESDLRTQYQGIVNQNMLEIHGLKLEKHGFEATVNQEQLDNSNKSQKISYLESENQRLKEQISKMEKEKILTLKRNPLKKIEGKGLDIAPANDTSNEEDKAVAVD